MPKVSLIVPVYNAEENIRRCLDSILSQEFKDFEALIVDDGSKDSSPAILDEYAAKDSRIHVIHKENSGVSDTRNTALAKARGEYIQFMDADDWIPDDSMKMLVRTMEDKNVDMVIADFYRVVGDKLAIKGSIMTDQVMNRQEFAEYLVESPADYYYGVLWNKMFRRSIIEEHQLRMDTGLKWCEDFVFNLDYLIYAKTIAALQVPVYYYVKNAGSLVWQSMRIGNIVKMKTNMYQYYDKFFKDVFDEKQYRQMHAEIVSFLIAASGDDAVIPFMPGTKKLGEENVPVYFTPNKQDNIITTAYYLNKAFDKYLKTISLKYDLDLKDVRVFTCLKEAGIVKSQKEIADFTGFGELVVLSCLEKLVTRKYVKVSFSTNGMSASVNYETAEDLCMDIDVALQDLANICLDGFSEDEVQRVISVSAKITQNLKSYLKA